MKAKKPYARFLRERDTIKGAANGLLPHGWRRYVRANDRHGFPNMDRPVPRYWFSGNLVPRL